jgi:hypothetical protein
MASFRRSSYRYAVAVGTTGEFLGQFNARRDAYGFADAYATRWEQSVFVLDWRRCRFRAAQPR